MPPLTTYGHSYVSSGRGGAQPYDMVWARKIPLRKIKAMDLEPSEIINIIWESKRVQKHCRGGFLSGEHSKGHQWRHPTLPDGSLTPFKGCSVLTFAPATSYPKGLSSAVSPTTGFKVSGYQYSYLSYLGITIMCAGATERLDLFKESLRVLSKTTAYGRKPQLS